jgi:HSP20 family protein
MTLDELRAPMMSLFDSVATDLFKSIEPFGSLSEEIKTRAYPKVDVRTTDEDLIFEAVVPFVKKEDLDIYIENGTLKIKGKVEKDKTVEDKTFIKRELVRSSFARSFPLNDQMYHDWDLNGGEVKADLSEGILTITLVGFVKELKEANKPEVRQIDVG